MSKEEVRAPVKRMKSGKVIGADEVGGCLIERAVELLP